MRDDLFIERNTSKKVEANTSKVRTDGYGCFSILVVSMVFGFLSGILAYISGASAIHAVLAGIITAGLVSGLYFLTSIGIILFAFCMGIFGFFLGLYYYSR